VTKADQVQLALLGTMPQHVDNCPTCAHWGSKLTFCALGWELLQREEQWHRAANATRDWWQRNARVLPNG
jgi:hypothetical protein